jgi:hypothetical protein
MIKFYELGKGVIRDYRANTKGNTFTPIAVIQRKLTRNILLASNHINLDNCEIVHFYGNLYIYTKGNTIVRIKNFKHENFELRLNWDEYKKLNRMLGIDLYYSVIKEMKYNGIINKRKLYMAS